MISTLKENKFSPFVQKYFSMKINFNLRFIFILFLIQNISFSQGLIINKNTDKLYKKTATKYSSFSSYEKGLPKKMDMSMYLPSIMNQEDLGTCVGISSAYYLRTILEAKRLNITDKHVIDTLSFSPSYLYNAIKDTSDTECLNGTEITKALDFLKNNGNAKLTEQPYKNWCNNKASIKLKDESKIMDYIRVFGLIDQVDDINEAAKKALSEGTPLIAGIITTQSLQKMHFSKTLWARFKAFLGFKLDESEDYRLWRLDDNRPFRGGHALCIIGYDDNKYGGAYQVANSWGTWWGDNGLFWIKYTDFPKVAKYCFQAYLTDVPNKNETEMTAQVNLHFGSSISENDVPFIRNTIKNNSDTTNQLIAYQLPNQKDLDNYFFEADIDKQSYLYLIGKNENVNETQLLFPNADSTSALLGSNTKFILPSPERNPITNNLEQKLYSLVPPIGKEYWLFLFSKTKLDIHEYVGKLNKSKNKFPNQVLAVFGKKLVPFHKIKYDSKKIGFTLSGSHSGQIIPLLISFDHVPMEKGEFLGLGN